MSAAPSISARACAIGLPDSSVSRIASVSRSRSMRSATFKSTRARFEAVSLGQGPLSKAARAAAIAARASSARPRGTRVTTTPCAGLRRSIVSPSPRASRPPIHMARAVGKRARASFSFRASRVIGVWTVMAALLTAGENGRALGAKRRDALGKIFSECGQRAGKTFDRRVAILALGGVDHRLDHLRRKRTAFGDFSGEALRAGHAFALRGHFVDEAEGQAFFGREHAAAERHAADDRSAKAAHQPLRAGPAGRHAEAGFGEAKLDPALRYADVRDRRKLQAAAERVPRQRGHQGDAQARKRLERAVSRPRPVAPHLKRRQAAPGGDVAAGAERLALSGQDGGPRLARRVDGSRSL